MQDLVGVIRDHGQSNNKLSGRMVFLTWMIAGAAIIQAAAAVLMWLKK